jgi:hypothetical protein
MNVRDAYYSVLLTICLICIVLLTGMLIHYAYMIKLIVDDYMIVAQMIPKLLYKIIMVNYKMYSGLL